MQPFFINEKNNSYREKENAKSKHSKQFINSGVSDVFDSINILISIVRNKFSNRYRYTILLLFICQTMYSKNQMTEFSWRVHNHRVGKNWRTFGSSYRHFITKTAATVTAAMGCGLIQPTTIAHTHTHSQQIESKRGV